MFQSSFKYYKSKNPPPSFEDVLVMDTKHLLLKPHLLDPSPGAAFPGLLPPNEWKVYELAMRPGLLLLSNPFTGEGQREWIMRCLHDYPLQPNTTNILNQPSGIDWWEKLRLLPDPSTRRSHAKTLRWATLGYQYDWTNKVYDEAHRQPFPTDLATLVRYVATQLGYARFSPEAAIVNYYPIGTTLAGHTDHSEDDQSAPLFSFSFGQPAVFLIGGVSREEQPSALLLRSGDVVVMSGPARLCYHAVPRVFTDVELPEGMECSTERWKSDMRNERHGGGCWSELEEEYLQQSRININVRQVLRENQRSLDRSGECN
uniref:Fe2OG dioxygenase domain-containing protein n=1 Tax=Anopheles farauti TaxID=69004 RepID=A0A182QTH4_9DIPT